MFASTFVNLEEWMLFVVNPERQRDKDNERERERILQAVYQCSCQNKQLIDGSPHRNGTVVSTIRSLFKTEDDF